MLCAVVMAAVAAGLGPSAMVLMVIATGIGIIVKRSGSKRFCCFICRSLYTGVQFDSGLRKCHLSAHADATADQRIDFCLLQEACQQAVATTVGVYNLGIHDSAVFHIVQFELFRVTEVLEN